MTSQSLDGLGDLQRAVMEIVWEMEEGTVRQVRTRLNKRRGMRRLAYTTVLSVMQKLEKGGWLSHESDGRTYVYKPTRTRQEEGASTVCSFTKKVFFGDPLLLFQHFMDGHKMKEEELLELKRMIDKRRKELKK